MNHDDMNGMGHMDMRMYMIINWEYEVELKYHHR